MRIGFFATLLFLVLAGISGCRQSLTADGEAGRQLVVSWELVSNFTNVKDGFEARFTIKNNSDQTLTDANWALFFNMSPRPIITPKTPQLATVRHINGDWYTLVPNKGFTLKPGASTEISYEGTEAVTKLTDAPLGLYVVLYDKA